MHSLLPIQKTFPRKGGWCWKWKRMLWKNGKSREIKTPWLFTLAMLFSPLAFQIGMLYASKLFHTWLEEIEKRCGQFSPPLYIILTRNIVSAMIALSQLVSSTIYILCFLQIHNFIWYALITSLPVDVNGLLMRKLPHWAGFCNRGSSSNEAFYSSSSLV